MIETLKLTQDESFLQQNNIEQFSKLNILLYYAYKEYVQYLNQIEDVQQDISQEDNLLLDQIFQLIKQILQEKTIPCQQLIQMENNQLNDLQVDWICIVLDIFIISLNKKIVNSTLNELRRQIKNSLVKDDNSIKIFSQDNIVLLGNIKLPNFQYFTKIFDLIYNLRECMKETNDSSYKFIQVIGNIDRILYNAKCNNPKNISYSQLVMKQENHYKQLIENIYGLSLQIYNQIQDQQEDRINKYLLKSHRELNLFQDLIQFQQKYDEQQKKINDYWLKIDNEQGDNINPNNVEEYSIQLIQLINNQNINYFDIYINFANKLNQFPIDMFIQNNNFKKGLLIYVTNLLLKNQLNENYIQINLNLKEKILTLLLLQQYYPNHPVIQQFFQGNKTKLIILIILSQSQQEFNEYYQYINKNYQMDEQEFEILKSKTIQQKYNIKSLLENQTDNLSIYLKYILFQDTQYMLKAIKNPNFITYYQWLNKQQQLEFFKQLIEQEIEDLPEYIKLVSTISQFERQISQKSIQQSYVYIYLLMVILSFKDDIIKKQDEHTGQIINLFVEISILSTTWMDVDLGEQMVLKGYTPQLVKILINMKKHSESYNKEVQTQLNELIRDSKRSFDIELLTPEKKIEMENYYVTQINKLKRYVEDYRDRDWIQLDSSEEQMQLINIMNKKLQEFEVNSKQSINTNIQEFGMNQVIQILRRLDDKQELKQQLIDQLLINKIITEEQAQHL